MIKSSLTFFKIYLQYIPVYLVMQLVRSLPIAVASNFAGWLGRSYGRKLKSMTRTSRINLQQFYPGITPAEVERIQNAMYDNMARTFVEYLFLDKLERIKGYTYEIKGEAYLELLKDPSCPTIVYSAHYGNWEVGAWYASHVGGALTPVYRHINNPLINKLMNGCRAAISNGLIVNDKRSPREILEALKRGKNVVMLIDQHKKRGGAETVPFFGLPAQVPTGVARLARAGKATIVPTRVTRKGPLHFVIEALPALTYEDYADKSDLEVLTLIYQQLEEWIREHPEQWFWTFRRWDKEFYLDK